MHIFSCVHPSNQYYLISVSLATMCDPNNDLGEQISRLHGTGIVYIFIEYIGTH